MLPRDKFMFGLSPAPTSCGVGGGIFIVLRTRTFTYFMSDSNPKGRPLIFGSLAVSQ